MITRLIMAKMAEAERTWKEVCGAKMIKGQRAALSRPGLRGSSRVIPSMTSKCLSVLTMCVRSWFRMVAACTASRLLIFVP